MTSISERVDKLVGKVGNVESKMSKMDARMDSMETKMDKVDQDVKMNGWKYLGRGYMIGGIVEESGQGLQTLSQCCQICEDEHSADHQWNGFLWVPSNGQCFCEKNDKGHDPTTGTGYMHFMKQ